MSRLSRLLTPFLLPLLFVLSARITVAQESTATIVGLVSDDSGGVLPGATITARNVESGLSRVVVSDAVGRYRIPALPVGKYEVAVQLSGFGSTVRTGLVLTVGLEAVVNLTLSIGELSDKVTVTGDVPLVDTTSTTLSGVVDEKSMRALPLNGRSFDQLALLQPGVQTMAFTSQSITNGTGKDLIVSGSRWKTTLFLLDGTEINDVAGRSAGSASGNMLGVESVREFRVLSQNFNAEYGRASGGIVTAVSRSGTNDVHGSLYEFFRNDQLDARNYFDVGEAPPFTRNQFGASFGGPVVKDRSFFFANFEGLRQTLGLTNVAVVPTARVHQGVLADANNPGQFVQVPMTSLSRLAMDTFYPLPNAGDIPNSDGGVLVTNPEQRIHENYLTAKIDHVFTSNHSVFARYTLVDSDRIDHLSVPVSQEVGRIKNQYFTLQDQIIVSPKALNALRFGFNQSHADDHMVDIIDIPEQLRFVPGSHIGNLRITGFDDVGETGSLPRETLMNLYELNDDFSYATGGHTLKAGASVKLYRVDAESSRRANGRYDFSSLRNFFAGTARRFEASLPSTDTFRRWREWLFGFYVQDDFAIAKNVRINAGIRYEPYTKPLELDGKMANLLDPLGSTITKGELFHNNPSLANVQPRIGAVWNPGGSGKTSVRSAVGVFQDPLLPGYYLIAGARIPPFFQSATLNNPPFPNAYALYSGTNQNLIPLRDINSFDPKLKTPSYVKWHVTLERELGGNFSGSIGYVGNRGYNLVAEREGNTAVPTILADGSKFFPSNAQPRNPNFASNVISSTNTSSHYNGMNVTIKRRSSSLQFQAVYTLSKQIDEISGTGGAVLLTQGAGSGLVLTDPDDPSFDTGLSSWDRRHNFVSNFSYELPAGDGHAFASGGLTRALLGGWIVNGIVTLSSGTPLNLVVGRFDSLGNLDSRTPNRPNLRAGFSGNPVLGGVTQYFDLSAFEIPKQGTFGNLERNSLTSPGIATVDLALVKIDHIHAISQGFTVETRIECFNLLNRANFGQPGRELFNSDGSILPTAGVITNTTTPSRQIQLGIRFGW